MNRIQRIFSPVLVAMFVITSAVMVSACGFQLRGTVNVASDLDHLSLQVADRSFQRILSQTLEQTGITVSDSAPYTLNVLDLSRKEVAASTSGGNIVTDYDVIATLSWQLEDETGLALIPASELSQSGTYQRRENEYNASRSELEIVWGELQHNLATTLVRRVAALTDAQLQEMTAEAEKRKVAAVDAAARTNSINQL